MLLRNRSRAVNKPNLMADHHTTSQQPSPKPNHQNYARTTIPSLFCSPKFRDFTIKCFSANEALPSPTSILDTRTLSSSPFGNNPFSHDNCHNVPGGRRDDNNKSESTNISPRIMHLSERKSSYDKIDSRGGIGLGLVGALKDDDQKIDEKNSTKPSSGRSVLFGTQLRVKIPPFPPSTFNPFEPNTCFGADDFGTKTNKDSSQNYELCAKKKDCSHHPQAVAGGSGLLTLSEMELSEDYTCVISHGPNPRTTHIFDNCIVESYCSLPNNNKKHSYSSVSFLSFCYTCKKHLEQTKDIFIYRGDRAFCSKECRHQEMVLDGAENSEFDGN